LVRDETGSESEGKKRKAKERRGEERRGEEQTIEWNGEKEGRKESSGEKQ
jgi:hypothetical protein